MKEKVIKITCSHCGAISIQSAGKVVYRCKKCGKKNVIDSDFELEGKLKNT